MNFTKEQIDYIKKAVDHVDFLTGGSRNSKTKQIIEELQQENQQLKDKINTYENPEDLTLMFMYCDEKAKDKIKQLKDKLKGEQEERDYLFNKTSVENKYLQQERDKYKKVIEEVKDRITIKLGRYINEKDYVIDDVALDELLQILDKVKD